MFWIPKIVAKFPGKGWKLCSVKAICKRVDVRGSATERNSGKPSGRPKTARTEENVRYLKGVLQSKKNELAKTIRVVYVYTCYFR